MWTEVIFNREDIDRLLKQLTPVLVDLGSSGDHVELRDPQPVELVAGEGIRVTCAASLRWSILGIALPLTVRSATLMVRPEVVVGDDGRDRLAVGLMIEHVDFESIPTFVDDTITDKINAALREKKAALSWSFADWLNRTVELPAAFGPDRALTLEVAWAKIRVDEALVLAISAPLHSTAAGRRCSGPAGAARPERAPGLASADREQGRRAGPAALAGGRRGAGASNKWVRGLRGRCAPPWRRGDRRVFASGAASITAGRARREARPRRRPGDPRALSARTIRACSARRVRRADARVMGS